MFGVMAVDYEFSNIIFESPRAAGPDLNEAGSSTKLSQMRASPINSIFLGAF